MKNRDAQRRVSYGRGMTAFGVGNSMVCKVWKHFGDTKSVLRENGEGNSRSKSRDRII